jgi:hypothetical protein
MRENLKQTKTPEIGKRLKQIGILAAIATLRFATSPDMATAAQVNPDNLNSNNNPIELKQDRQNRSPITDTWGGPGGRSLSEVLGEENNGRMPPPRRQGIPTGRSGPGLDGIRPPIGVPGQTPLQSLRREPPPSNNNVNSRGRS